ncbi:MAG: LysE family translocator [Bacteroidetes bacterium]|nr:LysE family translocator [Bacteroidota bacterium]
MTITPGPNNMLITASGTQFGYKRTFPFIIGILVGVISMMALCGMGLGLLFERYPVIQQILKVSGSLYILYLASKLFFKKADADSADNESEPLSFIQGVLFQYVNPKAYVFSITTVSVYSIKGELFIPSILFIMGAFLCIGLFSISVWAAFGTLLGKYMKSAKNGRWINYALALITAGSVVFILV